MGFSLISMSIDIVVAQISGRRLSWTVPSSQLAQRSTISS
jgi:hypothetical protein